MSEKTQTIAPKSDRFHVRARIQAILDAESFIETDKYLERSNAVLGYPDVTIPGEGVVTGWGTVEGRAICIAAEDFASLDGSFSAAHANKIASVIDMAAKSGRPVVLLWDSQGARLQEGAAVLNAYAMLMKKLTDVSGVVPTISVATGGMFGSAAFFASLADFTIVVENLSSVGIKGPTVVAASLGIDADEEKTNGAAVQAAAGNAHFLCKNEQEAYAVVKRLLGCLPSNNLEEAPFTINEDPLDRKVAAASGDMRALIGEIADNKEFFEVQAGFGKEILTGFAAIGGVSVGVVANAGGCYLEPDACEKAARFVRLLDAYHIPIMTFVDNLGAKVSMEQSVFLRALAKLAYAYAEAGTPMVSLIAGKAIGEGYSVMSNKGNGADVVYALQGAEIGCLNAEAGSIILYGGSKTSADEYKENFLSPLSAARQGVVDDVIRPEDTRFLLIKAVQAALDKREGKLQKKHGVMPL